MKRHFLTRTLREKVLVTVFIGFASLTWLFSSLGRGRALAQEWRSAAAAGAEQRMWLANQAPIEAQAARSTGQLDAARTLNGARLIGELNALAGQAGLAPEVSGQRTERTTQFAFHSAQVSFRRADLASLVRFYEEISKRSPYIGLEQVSLAIDRGAPGTVNATFRVVAAELQR
ncbi:MAG: general secretion pathway protein GspM [Opitutus sp.]|nr:general secretion pathway protein GspM [Opitutus sp.]